jgi:uncharacterized protein
MDTVEKAIAVEQILTELDDEISRFQSWSHLSCQWGCGKCCYKPDIEASVLEFLPFALHIYKLNEAEQWLDRLRNHQSPVCLILNPVQGGAGLCSQYKHRGLICRLFGYSARTNKYGTKELVTCQIIKTEQSASFQMAENRIADGESVPVMSQYYMKLHAIDHQMAQEFFPINEAIKRALEAILHYYAYRS